MGLHDGHRDRLRKRFIEEGAEGFAAHNLLELLLFYAIPRKDTNETAHLLLRRFGDVQSVLSAPIEELCKVEGINQSSAALIRMCGELGTRYCAGRTDDLKRFYSFDDIGEYLVKLYWGVTEETVYVLLLNSGGSLIKTAQVCTGSVNSTAVNMRAIVSAALSANAACVVLAHNHPGGTAFPSAEDLTTTKTVANALAVSGIELAEHFVVAGRSYRRIMEQVKSAESARLEQSFFFRADENM